MDWFRLYSEVVRDPKVQRLPASTFKNWINILCLASDNEPRGIVPSIKDVAFHLRFTEKKTASVLKELVSAGLVDEVDDRYEMHSWKARQFVSDNVTERVRKHRRNVSVTPPDTETDQIQNRTDPETEAEPPTEVEELLPFEPREPVIKELTPAYLIILAGRFPAIDVTRERQKYEDYNRQKNRSIKDHGAAFRNWLRNAEDYKHEKVQRNTTGRNPTGNGAYASELISGWEAYARGE